MYLAFYNIQIFYKLDIGKKILNKLQDLNRGRLQHVCLLHLRCNIIHGNI